MKKITITEKKIEIEGFDNHAIDRHGGTCRDVTREALAWAVSQLNVDLVQDLAGVDNRLVMLLSRAESKPLEEHGRVDQRKEAHHV